MRRFYRVTIDKRPVGTAIEHREPPLLGKRITHVRDTQTRGDFRVVVLDATNAEHTTNLALTGVQELKENEAVDLAARYQPRFARDRLDPTSGKVKMLKESHVDLLEMVAQRELELKGGKAPTPDTGAQAPEGPALATRRKPRR